MEQKSERRKYPRVKDQDVAIKLSGEGFTTVSQSLDISASGVCCKVDRHLPVMTKVEVVLVVPSKSRSSSHTTLDIEGVVVREQPVKKGGKIQQYDVAIFFTSLTPKERDLLINYIEKKAK